MKGSRKWLVLLIVCIVALCGMVAFLWLNSGRSQPAARLQVISATATNQGQIVRFRLIPSHGGEFLANTTFQLAYDQQVSLQGMFSCGSTSPLQGVRSGPKDFDIFFPDDYPIWRLQVEVQTQAPLFERLKWDVEFTFQSLRGFGWLPTPPQFERERGN